MTVNRKTLKPFSVSGKSGTPSLQGVWQNELGSTMAITSFDGTNFQGTYTSSVSSGGGSVQGALTGTLAGDGIGFTVNWNPTYSSVTCWSGILLAANGNLAIYSLWHLASTPESQNNFWESIQAGADLFFQTS